MKKIAIVAPDYFFTIPSIYGGACEELMTILLNQNELNKKADIYLLQKHFDKQKMNELQKFKFNNSNIIYIKSNKFYDFFIKCINKAFKILKINKKFSSSYDRKVVKFLNKNKMDNIVFEANFPANACSLNYNRNQIYTHRHTQDEQKADYFKHIGNLIGVSNFICNDWKSYLQENNINNVKLHVLHNVVNENKFNKDVFTAEKAEIRKSLNLTEDDFVVIYCGRIVEVKGIKPLIESVLQLDKKIKLVIIGSPNFTANKQTKYLEDVISLVNNNSDRIKFTGYIQNKDLYKYYQMADLQVVPSIWEEAAGLVVIEGMLCGLPQIITKSGGMPEYVDEKSSIIVDKNNNLVNNLKDSINLVFTNTEKRNEMIMVNKNRANKYNSKQFLENFIDIMGDNND